MTSSILYSGGIKCQWQLKVKCDYFNLFLYLFSLFLVTVTVLCDGGINCRWKLKVKCDYFNLFFYLFSLFFSDCYHIVWWRNQLSMATQGKMWLLNQARAWFLKIDPVRLVGMRVCVCVCVFVCPRPRLLITSGVIWTSYDWLNKLDSCYMATVVVIVNGCDLGIGTRPRH